MNKGGREQALLQAQIIFYYLVLHFATWKDASWVYCWEAVRLGKQAIEYETLAKTR
jgi:hypothetical protein